MVPEVGLERQVEVTPAMKRERTFQTENTTTHREGEEDTFSELQVLWMCMAEIYEDRK